MQILPTLSSESISSLTDTFFIGANYQAAANDNFANELARQQQARDAVANDETHSVQVALESTPQVTPLNSSPYNLTSDNGITYTTEEVVFTQKELEDLERDLRREGAPEETLTELKKLTEQPGGSTLGEVMVALQSQRDYPTLSKGESETLKGLVAKMDASGDLYSTVTGLLEGRDGKAALEALVKGMGGLNGGTVQVSVQEMNVLAKAAGLSDTATQQMLSLFGKNGTLQLNQGQLASLLSPALNDFSLEAANMKQLNAAIDKTLGTLLQEAKDRMAAEKEASSLSTRKSEQSKVVIEKTVLENVNNTLEGTRASQLDAQVDAQVESQLKGQADTKLNADKLQETLDSKLVSDKESLKEFNAKNDAKDTFGGNDARNGGQSDSRNDAWGQLLEKANVRAEVAAMSASKNITTPVIGIGGLASDAQQVAQKLANASHTQRTQMASQAAAQVEKALLTAARDGSKSIELQLHPAELGALNITLTARNGEVSAILRSERSETAELLHRQMEQIRAQLEDQGVKIDKIEVRQGTQDNSASYDSWSGMQEHNARQEENAQKEWLERLRNLAKVRNDVTNVEEQALEHNMHREGNTAGNAAQSLYVVA